MNFEEAKIIRAEIAAKAEAANAVLMAIPGIGGGAMGLTPDRVKSTKAYQEAHRAMRQAFAAERHHNAFMVKTFKREMAAERAARRPVSL